MLDPDVVANSIAAALQSIPELVAELGGPAIPATESISVHSYYSGEENSVARVVSQMRAPSLLIAYWDYLGGNFDGTSVWKHRVNLYIRSRNKASNGGASSAPHLWWMCMNLPVTVPEGAPNLRYVSLCGGNLEIMDIPPLLHQTDELGQDFFYSTMVFPERGDAGPDGVDFYCMPAMAAAQGES
ncbi:MAG TPA: hypothetical protein VGG62_17745 [Terracidiphilus sp.]|jgi:hypothetical protein